VQQSRESFNSTHVYGTHAPVEEPSTASKADIGDDEFPSRLDLTP